MKKKNVLNAILLFVVSASTVSAQFSTSVDLVSNYVFRGVEQDLVHPRGTPNIQPSISYTVGGLSIGTWGSYAISGTVKEVDLYVTYAFPELFSVTLTDYNWGFTQNYFYYGKNTDHVFEGSVNYLGVPSFPLSVSANVMFYGADTKANGKQAYSTYVELNYSIANNVKLFLGSSLTESLNYGTDGFGVTNVGIKVNKNIPITDKYGLPIFGILGFNPNAKDPFLVAGMTL
jgi:uncharacterized protein (TIGR02001 family)